MTEAALREPGRPDPHADVLTAAWARRPGFLGWLAAVNHKDIGLRFVWTSFGFFLVGGVLALLVRVQLAVPENDFLSAEAYNQVFTMHGTTMMFLFAVPMVEGLAMYLLPLMLGTRDLPFPRLNAFGYWCFLFGGLFVYASFLTGEVPKDGWFAYVPLTDPFFSPDRGMDFWLLGVTFVEVAGIIGAIELIVCFFKRRAPGMVLSRVPLFAWAVLVMAFMMLFAFPALVTASVLLEVERVFGTNFYDPAGGGDPLLWQHLFWFFGHPEVYIMLLPATGIVSMVVPVFARTRIAGYPFIVAALIAIGLISFGLWVHHMFAVGFPLLAMGFFAAASFTIVIPSGVQVFAWLATLWRGTPVLRTPLLFALGFVITFVLGGITGVMVAAVPFDWQVHDSFFVVAHFHYVLIGGVVFPIFAGLFYWWPKWTGTIPAERLGQASFWTMLLGFNLAFFPQHLLGFEGMPRRVFTYQAGDGLTTGNFLSTVGAFVLAAGVGIAIASLVVGRARGRTPAAADPWQGESLEWATESPPPAYNFARLPTVGEADARTSELAASLAAPGAEVREVIETTSVGAVPERVVRLPGPSLWPLGTALSLALALVGALFYDWAVVATGVALMVVCLVAWVAGTTAEGRPRDGVDHPLPTRTAGAGVWGVVLGGCAALVVLGSLVFAYFLLRSHADEWPAAGSSAPPLGWAVVALALAGGSAFAAFYALSAVRAGNRRGLELGLVAAVLLGGAFAAAVLVSLGGLGLDASESGYASVTLALVAFALLLAATLVLGLALVGFQVARGFFGPEEHAAVQTVALLAAGVALTWPVVLLVAYVVPHAS